MATVVHTNGVNLLFVTLDAVGRADVISEDPSLSGGLASHEGVGGSTCEQGRAHRR